MRKYIFFAITLIMISSCLRLDDNLFNNDNTISEYLFDEYTGESEITLPDEYAISTEDDDFHYFTLVSDLDGDKATIHAVYLGDIEKISTDTVIMYCHGNKDHMDFYWHRQKLLYNSNNEKGRFGVLMLDYRGFGLSEGKTTEKGLVADIDAGLKWLKDNGLSDSRLIIYGFSLGSIPAVAHCANSQTMTPDKLILEAPIGSIETMIQDGSELSMPSSFFADLETNNIELIKKVNQPLLLLHGIDDAFLSYNTQGKPIYDNHKGEYKVLIPVSGADHGNVPILMGFEVYAQKVGKFILGQH